MARTDIPPCCIPQPALSKRGKGLGPHQGASLLMSLWQPKCSSRHLSCPVEWVLPRYQQGLVAALWSLHQLMQKRLQRGQGSFPACTPSARAPTGALGQCPCSRHPPAHPLLAPAGAGRASSPRWCGDERDHGCRSPEQFCSWRRYKVRQAKYEQFSGEVGDTEPKAVAGHTGINSDNCQTPWIKW